MKYAILADIHGNLEALQAVLADLERWEVDRLFVLGDVIGYGPDPRACLAAVAERADVLLVGNHEAAALTGRPEELGEVMAEVLRWSARQVEDLPVWRAWQARADQRGVDALAEGEHDGIGCYHGAPGSPVATYVWPGHSGQYLKDNRLLDGRLASFLRAQGRPLAFCGHTHIPALLAPYAFHSQLASVTSWNHKRTFVGPRCLFLVPDDTCRIDLRTLPGLGDAESPFEEPIKVLVNPGSVGQPRDEDLRACYAVLADGELHLVRLAYDVETTRGKVRAMPVADAAREGLLLRLGVTPRGA